jgi:hypothetical protein
VFVPTGTEGPGVHVLDVSEPSDPTLIASFAESRPRALASSGTRLLAVDGANLDVVDVTTPATPGLLARVPLDGGAGNTALAVAAAGEFAYVGGGGPYLGSAPALRVVDLGDPSSPVLRGSSAESGASDLAASGSLVYAAAFEGGLWIYDVSDPDTPVRVSALPLGGSAEEVEQTGALAVLRVDDQVVAVDVSDPSQPFERSRVTIPTSLYARSSSGSILFPRGPRGSLSFLSIAGDAAYLAGSRGAVAVDLSDPDAVSPLGAVGDDALSGGVAGVGNHLVHVGLHGVQVLEPPPASAGVPGCPDASGPGCGLVGLEALLLVAAGRRVSRLCRIR